MTTRASAGPAPWSLSALVVALLLATTHAGAQGLANGGLTSWGSASMPAYLVAGAEGTALQATILLTNQSLLGEVDRLFVEVTAESGSVDVRLDAVLVDGDPAPLVNEPTDPSSRTVDLAGLAWHNGSVELVVHGHADPQAAGRFQVGILAIPFAAGWSRPSGEAGQELYAFTIVGSRDAGASLAPLEGQGNSLWVAVPLVAAACTVAGLVAVGLRRRRSRSG